MKRTIGSASSAGNNANVFFELGIAYERNKPIIFLTQDDPKDAPVDIRPFEFIRYQLDKHEDFLPKLDNAVRNFLGSLLDILGLYEKARHFLNQFNADTQFTHAQAAHDEFQARVIIALGAQGIPRLDDTARLAPFLLTKILQDTADINVMKRLTVWRPK